MAKKSNPSQTKTLNISVKQGGIVLFIMALLILGANWLLNQNGESLPPEITDTAEGIIADSLEEGVLKEAGGGTETSGETAVSNPPTITHAATANVGAP
ncbi:MAG: hypothetical protein GWP17_02445 [Aquificales bacterium]|nr:hypothetical protein [Aquificales bacterium]